MIGTSPNCPVAGTNGPVLGPCVEDNVCHRHYSPTYTDNSDDGCRGFRSVSPSRSAISKEICLAFHDPNDNGQREKAVGSAWGKWGKWGKCTHSHAPSRTSGTLTSSSLTLAMFRNLTVVNLSLEDCGEVLISSCWNNNKCTMNHSAQNWFNVY